MIRAPEPLERRRTMFRIAVIALFAGTVGALLGGGLTDHFLRGDVAMVAANDAAANTAPIGIMEEIKCLRFIKLIYSYLLKQKH